MGRPYSVQSDVRIRAGVVGNLNISTASITSKITMADSIIDGKISDAYSLPLDENPGIIGELSIELAGAMVLIDEYGKEAQGTDKDGQARWDRAMDILTKIQKKEIKVISDTTGTELATSGVRTPSFRPNNLSNASSDEDINTSPRIRIQKTY